MNGTTEKELIAYNQEILDVLEKLKAELPEIPELDYFFDLARTYHSIEAIREKRPEILVMGTEVPEELVLAPGKRVYWILGGSPRAGAWAGELAPRDTDPVSRSMLGFLENEWDCLPEDALILIPTVNDSRRKIAYLLRRAGRKVHTIDVPPVKGAWAGRQWQRQWELCAEALSAHTGRRITPKKIRQISEQTGFCSLQMKRLLQLPNLSGRLTGPCRLFLLNSYYWAEDRMEWGRHLADLTKRKKQMGGGGSGSRAGSEEGKNEILLMGSPVYFPNYKLPFLLEESGLHVSLQIDSSIQKLLSGKKRSRKAGDIPEPTMSFYQMDGSDAYPKNETLFSHVTEAAISKSIDGVVYQVLKGQIGHDFELERYEGFFAARNIPVFRLETDYNYQDVEQLRIRLEAFREMLEQRNYKDRQQSKYGKEEQAV